jgi:hypothetical protein
MSSPAWDCIEEGRQRAQLSPADLWYRYFALGGSLTPEHFDQLLTGNATLSRHDYSVIAQALNDHFIDSGQNSPVPSAGEFDW